MMVLISGSRPLCLRRAVCWFLNRDGAWASEHRSGTKIHPSSGELRPKVMFVVVHPSSSISAASGATAEIRAQLYLAAYKHIAVRESLLWRFYSLNKQNRQGWWMGRRNTEWGSDLTMVAQQSSGRARTCFCWFCSVLLSRRPRCLLSLFGSIAFFLSILFPLSFSFLRVRSLTTTHSSTWRSRTGVHGWNLRGGKNTY